MIRGIAATVPILLVLLVVTGCGPTLNEKRRAAEQAAEQEANNRRQIYVMTHWGLDAVTRSRILEGQIGLGMKAKEVVASWGQPDDINKTVGSWGVHEQWVYGYTKYYGSGVSGFVPKYFLYLENGRLTSWQNQ